MRENQLQKALDNEFKVGIKFFNKWSNAITAHLKKGGKNSNKTKIL